MRGRTNNKKIEMQILNNDLTLTDDAKKLLERFGEHISEEYKPEFYDEYRCEYVWISNSGKRLTTKGMVDHFDKVNKLNEENS